MSETTWAFVAGMVAGIVLGFFGIWSLIVSGAADEED